MLNVGRIENGFVLDHIKAGKAMTIYHDLKLDKMTAVWPSLKMPAAIKWAAKTLSK